MRNPAQQPQTVPPLPTQAGERPPPPPRSPRRRSGKTIIAAPACTGECPQTQGTSRAHTFRSKRHLQVRGKESSFVAQATQAHGARGAVRGHAGRANRPKQCHHPHPTPPHTIAAKQISQRRTRVGFLASLPALQLPGTLRNC